MPFAVGYWELLRFQIASGECLRKNGFKKGFKKVNIEVLTVWGKTILGNYDKRAKPMCITVKSMKSSLKREQRGIWYSKRVQGRGSQKSVTRCVATTY